MSSDSHSGAASLRPFAFRRRALLFAPRSSARAIEELASDDYGEDQRRVWAAAADYEAAFGARLAKALTLIATVDGEAAGFASLKGADVVDMLYVSILITRGARVGTTLLDAVTRKLAASTRRQAIDQRGQRYGAAASSNARALSRSAAT